MRCHLLFTMFRFVRHDSHGHEDEGEHPKINAWINPTKISRNMKGSGTRYEEKSHNG